MVKVARRFPLTIIMRDADYTFDDEYEYAPQADRVAPLLSMVTQMFTGQTVYHCRKVAQAAAPRTEDRSSVYRCEACGRFFVTWINITK